MSRRGWVVWIVVGFVVAAVGGAMAWVDLDSADKIGSVVGAVSGALGLVLSAYALVRTWQSQPVEPSAADAPELEIAVDGSFVGGDDVAAEVVVDLLDVAVAERALRIRAVVLEDLSYKRRFPRQFAELQRHVRAFELSAGRLMRGCVHYALRWDEADLAEALIELRSLELPGLRDRESWFVWPSGKPRRVVTVQFDASNIASIRTGSYHADNSDRIPDLPPDEPIWLVQISPSIVWSRVVPAVIAHRRADYPGPGDPPVLDITDWVLSDRRPDELVRVSPSTTAHELGSAQGTWAW